jgi:hypothetical protein
MPSHKPKKDLPNGILSVLSAPLHRSKSDSTLRSRSSTTEIVAIVVPPKVVPTLLKAPVTRTIVLKAPQDAPLVSAAIAEAQFIEQAYQKKVERYGRQAILDDAKRHSAKMKSYSDTCRAKMRERRNSGRSGLQFSNHCAIRLSGCWKSELPVPELLRKYLKDDFLDFRKFTERVVGALWENDRPAFVALVDALSTVSTTCRWQDPGGVVRTEAGKSKGTKERNSEVIRAATIKHRTSAIQVFDDSGDVVQLSVEEYLHEMQTLQFSTILALRMHVHGDFENFGRVVAAKPEAVWRDLCTLKDGAIFEEEGMHTSLNEIVRNIIYSSDRLDHRHRRYLARDMFANFTEFHAAVPKLTTRGKGPLISSWVKNKVHDPHNTGKDKLITKDDDAATPAFHQYMERSLALDDLASLPDNVRGSALLTAIVVSGSLRYAASLKERDKQDIDNLNFYLGLIFTGLQAAVTAAPKDGSAFGDVVVLIKDAVTHYVDHLQTFQPRDILDILGQCVIALFYNPAVEGVIVPGLCKDVIDPIDEFQANVLTRRMELGRDFAEFSHRYLADLLPNLGLWTCPEVSRTLQQYYHS